MIPLEFVCVESIFEIRNKQEHWKGMDLINEKQIKEYVTSSIFIFKE